jgi:hypothetical protein
MPNLSGRRYILSILKALLISSLDSHSEDEEDQSLIHYVEEEDPSNFEEEDPIINPFDEEEHPNLSHP